MLLSPPPSSFASVAVQLLHGYWHRRFTAAAGTGTCSEADPSYVCTRPASVRDRPDRAPCSHLRPSDHRRAAASFLSCPHATCHFERQESLQKAKAPISSGALHALQLWAPQQTHYTRLAPCCWTLHCLRLSLQSPQSDQESCFMPALAVSL